MFLQVKVHAGHNEYLFSVLFSALGPEIRFLHEENI